MPYSDDRVARLYYDRGCGSCRLFARAVEGTAHHGLVAIPLDAPAADGDLGGLPEETRYGSAHLVTGTDRHAGSEIVAPLARMVLGERLAPLYARLPFVDRTLRWGYVRLWNHRRSRGCAAATFS